MAGRRRRTGRHGSHAASLEAAAGSAEPNPQHIRRIEDALRSQDVSKLRICAADTGFLTPALRAAAWPLLAGVPAAATAAAAAAGGEHLDDALHHSRSSTPHRSSSGGGAAAPAAAAGGWGGGAWSDAQYICLATTRHRDSEVVRVDVERSLWAFTQGWSEASRGHARQQLIRILTAAVNAHNVPAGWLAAAAAAEGGGGGAAAAAAAAAGGGGGKGAAAAGEEAPDGEGSTGSRGTTDAAAVDAAAEAQPAAAAAGVGDKDPSPPPPPAAAAAAENGDTASLVAATAATSSVAAAGDPAASATSSTSQPKVQEAPAAAAATAAAAGPPGVGEAAPAEGHTRHRKGKGHHRRRGHSSRSNRVKRGAEEVDQHQQQQQEEHHVEGQQQQQEQQQEGEEEQQQHQQQGEQQGAEAGQAPLPLLASSPVVEEPLALLRPPLVPQQQQVFYYQGLHDVASVLLLQLGERPAAGVLAALLVGHLRDASRESLDATMEVLGLMGAVVEAADPPLAQFTKDLGLMPWYALSWAISWFSHDLADLEQVARLFDVFIAHHPMLPLYVGAVAMRSQRGRLLEAEDMPNLHSMLVNLDVTKALTVDQLVKQALQLFSSAPPSYIIMSGALLLQRCITPRAVLRGGAWRYPPPRLLRPGQWSAARLAAFVEALLQLPPIGRPQARRSLALASLTGVLSVSLLVLLYSSQLVRLGVLTGSGGGPGA